MNLPEASAQVEALRAERAAQHEKLHALLADEMKPQGEARREERMIRDAIVEINKKCYPLEVLRGKAIKLTKGQRLSEEEIALMAQCKELLGGVEIVII